MTHMARKAAGLLIVLAILGPAPAHAGPATAADLESLAWMAGCWAGDTSGVRTEECWMSPAAGIMVGMNRVVGRGRASFDFMRIVADSGGVAFLASPGGRPPVRFDRFESGPRRVVFANPKHDFPQRVLYWQEREGTLHARIEGTLDGKPASTEWRWRAMNPAK
jgi:hypothetical protein